MIHVGLFVTLITTVFSSTTWTRIDSTCFQADKTRVTQQKATEICKERGGVLHSIKDSQEFGALKSVLGLSFHYWVSVKKINNRFRWADGRRCCPKDWWGTDEPHEVDGCATLYRSNNFLLWGYTCGTSHGFLCSRPAVKVWTLVNPNEYNLTDLCGVEIMPNCDGLPCEDLCQSTSNCNQFAKMANVCVNMNNISETRNCIVKLEPNLKLYSWRWCC